MENIGKGYTRRNICIISDSQASITALDSLEINSKLVWDCRQSLLKLVDHNGIQLVCMPGHMAIHGREIADQLARQGFSHLLTGPKSALGISA